MEMSRSVSRGLKSLGTVLLLAVFVAVLWAASYFAGGRSEFREAMHAAAQPADPTRATGPDVAEAIRGLRQQPVSEVVDIE